MTSMTDTPDWYFCIQVIVERFHEIDIKSAQSWITLINYKLDKENYVLIIKSENCFHL